MIRSVAADAWIQIFASLMLLSGALTVIELRRPQPPPIESAEVRVDAPHAAPADVPTAPGSGTAPVNPDARRWVVDAGMGLGADHAALAEAIAAAQDGDVISVRPGVYRETLAFSKTLTVVGVGNDPSEVRLESDGPRTVAVVDGQPIFRNLTFANSSAQPDTAAFEVVNARARLENVVVESSHRGLRAAHGKLTVERATIRAAIGLYVEGAASAECVDCMLTGNSIGAVVTGDGSSARFERSELHSSGLDKSIGVAAFPGVRVTIRSSRFSLEKTGVGLYAAGATVVGDSVTFQGGRTGVEASDGASVTLDHAQITGGAGDGLMAEKRARIALKRSTLTDNAACGARVDQADVSFDHVVVERDDCGVHFVGGGSLEAADSRFASLPEGAVMNDAGTEGKVTLHGYGNEGLTSSGLSWLRSLLHLGSKD